MVRLCRIPSVLFLAFWLAGGLGLAPKPVLAQVSADQTSARIGSEFGVEVLRVRAGSVDGIEVWLVTVMNPKGDSNAAFQVTTLAVDKATGDLVPAFRHGPSGTAADWAVRLQADQRPEAPRSPIWR